MRFAFAAALAAALAAHGSIAAAQGQPPGPPPGAALPGPPPPGAAPLSPVPEAPPAAPPAPYQPSYGPAPAPPPLSPGAAPPPLPAAPSLPYARRPVELIPELGLALPHCAAGSMSSDRCEGVKGGVGLGFSALWRVSPYFAWGGGFEIAGFGYQPPDRLHFTNTSAAAVSLHLIGRVYFLDEGSIDPYAQLRLGGGAFGTGYRDATGKAWQDTGAGPEVSVGGGFDFFLSRRIRLGPSIDYTRVFVDKIRHCNGSDCKDLSKDEQGHLNAYFTVLARLTIMIGDEL